MNRDDMFGLRIIECGNGFRVEYDNAKCREILKELMFSAVQSVRGRVCRECKGTGSQEEDVCTFCWGHGYVEAAPQPAQAATVSDARDAARYRWLRDWESRWDEDAPGLVIASGVYQEYDFSGESLDKFVDAAIASSPAAPAPVIPE